MTPDPIDNDNIKTLRTVTEEELDEMSRDAPVLVEVLVSTFGARRARILLSLISLGISVRKADLEVNE
jgi:hypothetical protein